MSSISAPSHAPRAAPHSKAGLLAAHLTEAGWLGLLVAVPLVMNVAAARTFEAAKLAAAAPVAAMLLFALIAAVIEGQARLPARAARQPALWAFAALIASAITATIFSETPWIAFFGDYFRREGLVSWLIYATLFASLVLVMRRRDQLERVIDTLLLVSVIPCVYALQQRFGYDFFATAGLLGGTAGARPGANLGNPTFLSAYLLLIIPVTIARLVNTGIPGGAWRARAPWVILLGLQLFAAILTQSRGPLLGLIAVLFLLAVALGGQLKLRALIAIAIGIGTLTIAGLLVLNLAPDLQGLVRNTPLQRFIFTGGNDLTANSRIGIWGMGADAFLHQPAWRQWIGSGADASHFNYFPWLPSWVMRIEGLTETIDRLHGESLETVMTFGLTGLAAQVILLSSLVWLVVGKIGHLGGRRPAAVFAMACVAAGLTAGYGLMAAGGSRGLFAIGAGLGVALAWSVALLLASWRSLAAGHSSLTRADAVLMAALTCALVGSWIESQVGVPTISTRLICAVYAALILLVCLDPFDAKEATAPAAPDAAAGHLHPGAALAPQRKRKRAKTTSLNSAAAKLVANARSYRPTVAGWTTSLALIIATAAYFPPLSGTVIHPPSPQRLHLIIVPLICLITAGALFAWVEARRTKSAPMDALTRFLVWLAVPWFAFLVVYAQIGSAITGAGDALVGERINALLMFSFAASAVMAAALGLALYHADPLRHTASRSKPLGIAVIGLSALACAGTYWTAMIDVRADTYAKLAGWAQTQNRLEATTAFYKTAADLLPQERRFTGSYAARLIERTAQDLGALPGNPALAPAILERLGNAEKAIEQALKIAPRDPWVTFAYANVQQFEGIGLLENYQPKSERTRHIELARQYFGIARAQFPGHPWILRNWAQMEIDLGNRAAAYQKFDQMEQLDPQNTANYYERLRFTRAFGDHAIAIESLRKGISAQPAGSAAETELKLALAKYHQQTGQPQQALNVWLEILRAHPDDVEVAGNVAETYAQTGQRELALGNAQAALARIATLPRSAKIDAAKIRLDMIVARLLAPDTTPRAAPQATLGAPNATLGAPNPAR